MFIQSKVLTKQNWSFFAASIWKNYCWGLSYFDQFIFNCSQERNHLTKFKFLIFIRRKVVLKDRYYNINAYIHCSCFSLFPGMAFTEKMWIGNLKEKKK